jgi:hypothetical protein
MKRTLISIEEGDFGWLEHYSRSCGQSLAKTIRDAIKALRKQKKEGGRLNALVASSGIWRDRKKDGLQMQQELRSEWE